MDLFLHDGMFVQQRRFVVRKAFGNRIMDLKLQFGFGMMDHSRALIESWSGGTVILSPRDLYAAQLEKLSNTINASGGRVWLDPQFYVPRADHERLCSHDYWPQNFNTGLFWQGRPLETLLDKLIDLNLNLQTSALLLPGVLADSVGEDWFNCQESMIEQARSRSVGKPLVCTIALSDTAVQDVNQIGSLLERAEKWDVDEFYIVAQHPGGTYLVVDPIWLGNMLDLAAGLRLLRKHVTLGYCTHQMLIASACKVSAISSGTWMNVRSFPPDKFVVPLEEEVKQRSKWYYCPQALSEYKMPYLDVAQRQGILGQMAPPTSLGSRYADMLFTGVQPTLVKSFTEQNAFRHYLHSVRSQANVSTRSSFMETFDGQLRSLDVASTLLSTLRARGVYGQLRDFGEAIDAGRSALQLLQSLRGPTLERMWTMI